MSSLALQYQRMVAQKAWQAWKRLPPQTRAWVSVEDLISDGMCRLLDLRKRYDRSRGSFSTLLWWSLDNYYKSYAQYWFMQKRFDGRTSTLAENASHRQLIVRFPTGERDVLSCNQFVHLYELASNELRRKLTVWFFEGRRRKGYGRQFAALRLEFLGLCRYLKIGPEDVGYWLAVDDWKCALPMGLVRRIWRDVGRPRA